MDIIKRLSLHPFTSTVGPTQSISSPLDVFNLFFSPDLMGKIVKESNDYAKLVNIYIIIIVQWLIYLRPLSVVVEFESL